MGAGPAAGTYAEIRSPDQAPFASAHAVIVASTGSSASPRDEAVPFEAAQRPVGIF
ncbi:hypothetical protein Val02_37230 [Virgisporangium aliadipatigenens]|uniref:Uncharacterized protein n=1 Tax=Virgisporangium aliadipatigenens TaxID=741659 RepID=A0A8J3YM55_9ACTN|nr:hypothetical protein Val02_37230 [Virgisporangium aliadipatigenens]